MKEAIREILDRDLHKLSDEISAYTDETLIWKTAEGISNSAGNLCLHLCGNLQHFIGAVLGKTGYVRQRDKEFSEKHISRTKLLAEIEKTKKAVQETLNSLDDKILKEDFPSDVLGKVHTTEFFLLHLIAHFNYHLG